MEIVYSTEKVANLEGRTFRNPRHFLGPLKDATKVFVEVTEWPKIAQAYLAVNVPVVALAELQPAPPTAGPTTRAPLAPPVSRPLVPSEPNP